jgi:hypothetical protein
MGHIRRDCAFQYSGPGVASTSVSGNLGIPWQLGQQQHPKVPQYMQLKDDQQSNAAISKQL